MTRGMSQVRGSITTPMTIGVNYILVKFNSEGRKIIVYADDVVIFVKGKFLQPIREISCKHL